MGCRCSCNGKYYKYFFEKFNIKHKINNFTFSEAGAVTNYQKWVGFWVINQNNADPNKKNIYCEYR